MRVLAGDIGGTKTLLQIAECKAGRYHAVREQRFDSASYDSLSSIVHEFLKAEKKKNIRAVCFGIAGPVKTTARGQSVKVTNLPWEIHGQDLKRRFKFSRLCLINDFQAIGHGIVAIGKKDLVVLQKGKAVKHGPRAVIGAGTGLGQGVLVWLQDHYEPIATEGGHANFAPTNELQIELTRHLLKDAGRTSWELVLSGHGLVELYGFLKARGKTPESPLVVRMMQIDDPAAVITKAALEQNDPLANQALDLFVDIYGAQAGNLALTAGATGGVYIAGGIAPKIISRLTDGRFMRAFLNKGKMKKYVADIPVRVAIKPEVGLIGAVLAAMHLI
ncbi:MAG: glucokinase [Sulfuricaulis sp.]|uniref:glucokinase n=1 Tax=Sulfuricaulis sp. TaxID=2003553 RepID=UPI0025DF932B|nr:glucokinase [Sulfuricaulis sp.]MCR4345644.1 glucokinase [Sulfuricaulis sp.]